MTFQTKRIERARARRRRRLLNDISRLCGVEESSEVGYNEDLPASWGSLQEQFHRARDGELREDAHHASNLEFPLAGRSKSG